MLRSALKNDLLNDEILRKSVKMGIELYRTFDATVKGKEIGMPMGLLFTYTDTTERNEIRIK